MAAEFIRSWQTGTFGGEMRNDLSHTAFLCMWMYVLCRRVTESQFRIVSLGLVVGMLASLVCFAKVKTQEQVKRVGRMISSTYSPNLRL